MLVKIEGVRLFAGVLYSSVRRFTSFPIEAESIPKLIEKALDKAYKNTDKYNDPSLIQIEKY